MLLKLVTCDVPAEERAAFEARQSDHGSMASARGFIAHAGGWLDEARTRAVTLSWWTDIVRYQLFQEQHRRQSGGRHAYVSGGLVLAKETFRVEAERADIRGALSSADAVRISDCSVPRGRLAQFVADQHGVWSRDREADGFICGSVLRVQQDDPRFLVVSLWEGAERGSGGRIAAGSRTATLAAVAPTIATTVPLIEDWRVLRS